MAIQINDGTNDQYSLLKMNSMQWKDQIEYIIGMASKGHVVDYLKMNYELIHKRLYILDHARYIYSFLKNVTMYQVLSIYDNLKSYDEQELLSKVITLDYPHLFELVQVHNHITLLNTHPETNIVQ